jgi:hypothetical protein
MGPVFLLFFSFLKTKNNTLRSLAQGKKNTWFNQCCGAVAGFGFGYEVDVVLETQFLDGRTAQHSPSPRSSEIAKRRIATAFVRRGDHARRHTTEATDKRMDGALSGYTTVERCELTPNTD